MTTLGAFARYRFREQLFPTRHFRLTYDMLKQWRGERAGVEYVRILHLAAQPWRPMWTAPCPCCWRPVSYSTTRGAGPGRAQTARGSGTGPVGKPDLKIYDGLLAGSLVGGVRMMDTATNVIQERIGQLV